MLELICHKGVMEVSNKIVDTIQMEIKCIHKHTIMSTLSQLCVNHLLSDY